MDFDVTRFGFYNAGIMNRANKLEGKQEKKVENTEEATQAAETKQAEGDGLSALSFQNIAGMKLAKKVDDNTAKDLNEMFEMAGVSTKFMPTQEVYSRIGASTVGVAKDFEEIQTEGNAEQFFASSEFQQLKDSFGIE